VPSIVAKSVREWVREPRSDDPSMFADAAIAMVHVARPAADDRPRGPGFGSLVHAVLAQAPFDADGSAIANLADIEARVLGLAGEDAATASAVVARVLSHDVLARARAADSRGACRRETPITYLLPEGTLLEGVIDLAFEEHGAWTVVDYKTDREIASLGEEAYRRQVALYASAIAKATGAPCSGVLLMI